MAAVAAAAFVVGGIGGCVTTLHSADSRPAATYHPLPHHVPKYLAGLTFRFAMAHDVVHERYPKHGPAFWRERERLSREKLARLDADSTAALGAVDDLAVALHRQGRSDEAILLLRDKLARQQRLKIEGKALYTTYDNLGTMLTDTSVGAALAGDARSKGRLHEAVELVRRAIAVNPEAHFGREKWQAAYGEFLLAAVDNPSLLTQFDFVGDRLTLPVGGLLKKRATWETDYGRAYDSKFMDQARWDVTAFFEHDVKADNGARWAELNPIRKYITKVGAEDGWKEVPVSSHSSPAAFDEPALGIVSMWRQGGGADPHLALALGEIMARVGQRYLAWTAFERAARIAIQFSSCPHARQSFVEHCRRREQEMEQSLRVGDGYFTDRVPEKTITGFRSKFDAELAHGERFQQSYQDYEAEKIAAGASIDDDHFYDEFNAGRPPIATPPGPEERYAVASYGRHVEYAIRRGLSIGALAAGLAAMGVALFFRGRVVS
jgi:hypothetical protein